MGELWLGLPGMRQILKTICGHVLDAVCMRWLLVAEACYGFCQFHAAPFREWLRKWFGAIVRHIVEGDHESCSEKHAVSLVFNMRSPKLKMINKIMKMRLASRYY